MGMVNVVLHGALRDVCPRHIRLEAKTPRLLLAGLKLIPELSPLKNKLRYLCKVEGVQTATDLDEPLERSEVNIYCEKVMNKNDITGSGDNPYVRVIIGVILIVVAVAYFMTTGDAMGAANLTQAAMTAMFAAGLSLVLGGITQLLTKQPKVEGDSDKNKSNTSYENTVRSGTPIPLIIGEHLHGGHIFSLNTETRYGKNLDITNFKQKFATGESPSWLLLYDGTNDEPTDQTPPGGRFRGGGGGGGPGNPYYSEIQR